MSSSRFSEQGYPGVSGNGPPFVDAGVLSAGHPGASGDDRSGTGRAGSRPGYPGVPGNGPPFVDAGVLSTGHPGASGDDRSGTGRAGSRPGHPGVMVYSAAAAHIDEGEHS